MKKTWLIALTTVLASLSSQAQNKTTWGSNEYLERHGYKMYLSQTLLIMV